MCSHSDQSFRAENGLPTPLVFAFEIGRDVMQLPDHSFGTTICSKCTGSGRNHQTPRRPEFTEAATRFGRSAFFSLATFSADRKHRCNPVLRD